MATQNVYFSIPKQPEGALPELGPGTPSLPTNPLGQGIVVGTSSNAGATFEVRVTLQSTDSNTDTPVSLTRDGLMTAAEVWKALERIKNFIRQRGYILGSGGPGTVAGSGSGPGTQTIPLGS